jgi:hypothetical protein
MVNFKKEVRMIKLLERLWDEIKKSIFEGGLLKWTG